MNRTNARRRAALASAGLALGLSLSACGGSDAGSASSGSGNQLSGTIRIDGSSTVFPLTEAAAELFREQNPSVQIPVGQSGTGGGFEKFCAGETDISNASRAIKDEEKAACAAKNVKFSELQVANDALTVVVSKENTWANCLTVEQLKKIWEPRSKVATWNQVDPSFPAEKLTLFGPGTDSGTFDFFTNEINGEEGASRTDYTPSENDNVIVQGVAGAKGALGYFGFTYFEENQDKLKALQIDSGGGCVAPGVESAQQGTYQPLSRPLFIYPSAAAMQRPEVKAFIDYYVTEHKTIAEQALFIPLSAEQEAQLKAALEALKSSA